jgi:hypothetical protein
LSFGGTGFFRCIFLPLDFCLRTIELFSPVIRARTKAATNLMALYSRVGCQPTFALTKVLIIASRLRKAHTPPRLINQFR